MQQKLGQDPGLVPVTAFVALPSLNESYIRNTREFDIQGLNCITATIVTDFTYLVRCLVDCRKTKT